MKNIRRFLRVIRGVPVEIFRRLIGWKWVLPEEIYWHDNKTGRSLSPPGGMRYDRYTLFPDLQKKDGKPSDGSPVHDYGWETGKWDDGSVLTFDDNNRVLRDILIDEQHRPKIICLVTWGVGLPIMRRKWKKLHRHA
ncbi:MAG: hypothetical protein GY820_39730 [Gammaproteobacteria bacterium]|nr:hypothetical protein [Gammaproteobacteria bacterium]